MESFVHPGGAEVAWPEKMFSGMQKLPMWKELSPVPREDSLVQMDRRAL
jgi:hypothetical protein